MRHIYSFNSTAALEAFLAAAPSGFYVLRDASLDIGEDRVRFVYVPNYFKVFGLEPSTVKFNPVDTDIELEYSTDYGTTWLTYTLNTSLNITMGCAIMFRGKAANMGHDFTGVGGGSAWGFTGSVELIGNITCLFDGLEEPAASSTFDLSHFFKGCRYVHSVDELTIPSKITSAEQMFKDCEDLWYGPSLANVVLTGTTAAFDHFFSGCTNLREVVALPNSLATTCFQAMYQDCLHITSIPSTYLPYTTLASGCYTSMFFGCSNLTNACALPATTIPDEAYQSMFSGTDITTPAIWNPTSFGDYAAASMYYGCPLTELPLIPTTATYGDYAFASAFYGTDLEEVTIPAITGDANIFEGAFGSCTDLEKVTINMAAIPATGFKNAFKGCTSLTEATINSTSIGANGLESAFENDTAFASITVKLNDVTPTDCTKDWLKNVAATGLFVNQGSAVYTEGSTSGIPSGWYAHPTDEFTMTAVDNISDLLYDLADDNVSFDYSLNGGTWTNWPQLQGISLTAGDILKIRGHENYTGAQMKAAGTYAWAWSGRLTLSGNLASLVKPNLADYMSYSGSMDLHAWFSGGSGPNNITSIEGLIFPGGTENYDGVGCYEQMFYGCGSLVNGKCTLPALTLTENCYKHMFDWCNNLTSTPDLPATTLATGCYWEMFATCSSLVNAMSVLPATGTIPVMAYRGMFMGTRVEVSPEIMGTILEHNACDGMFYGVNTIREMKSHITDASASMCTNNWLYNAASGGTFYNYGGYNFQRSGSGIPANWTIITD